MDSAMYVGGTFASDGTIMKIFNKILNMRAKDTKLVASLISESGPMTLAEAPVNHDGSFEIKLPDIVLGYSYLTSPTTIWTKLNITPRSLKIAVIDALCLFDENQNFIGFVFQGSSQDAIEGQLGHKLVSRWYSNHKSRVKGTTVCRSDGNAVHFKLDLQKGWNDVVRCFDNINYEYVQTSYNAGSMRWFMSKERVLETLRCSRAP